MLYVTKNEHNDAIIYAEEPQDIPFLKVNYLPNGSGALKTDLKTIWREPYPEQKIEVPLDKKLEAQQNRIDFLEDCIAEMAQVIYK